VWQMVDHVPTSIICPSTPIRLGDETFDVDIYVIPLQGYELVLGCQWLRALGPIVWDFNIKSMSFSRNDYRVKFYGITVPWTFCPCFL
jgi:hypothetical protein